MFRMFQILEKRGPLLKTGKQDWSYPALARDYLDQYWWLRLGMKGYRGKKPIERVRKFHRELQNIADRSTGLLGPWWVK